MTLEQAKLALARSLRSFAAQTTPGPKWQAEIERRGRLCNLGGEVLEILAAVDEKGTSEVFNDVLDAAVRLGLIRVVYNMDSDDVIESERYEIVQAHEKI